MYANMRVIEEVCVLLGKETRMRTSSTVRLVLCLLLLTALVGPEVASAGCRGKCVVVAPPFCRRCEDAGVDTGVLCQDSGNCGCFYIQCAAAPIKSVRHDQMTLADLGIASAEPASTLCASGSAGGAATLTN